MKFTATYSPEDNKLRLYSSARLDAETYAKVKALGFKWAPKQDLWVAPMWTPEREDVLIELAGEVEDEDKSLVDRQEERAERFEQYSDNRSADAEQARKAVDSICEHIPLGQPILIGHHSERHARKDAQRIENGMRKAVKMWETADYWSQRAAGALHLAKYKERIDVRARRIKGLESDERKHLKNIAQMEKRLKFWLREGITLEQALAVSNFADEGGIYLPSGEHHWSLWSALEGGKVELEYAIQRRRAGLPLSIAHQQRWLQHVQNRLIFERAMLGESGGMAADKFEIAVGGQVMVGDKWEIVLRINKKAGKIVSLRTTKKYGPIVGIEVVTDYKAPEGDDAARVAVVMKQPPLCNYAGEGINELTQEQWDKIPICYKGTRHFRAASDAAGGHRLRHAMGAFVLTKEQRASDDNKRHSYLPVFITDAKFKAAPGATAVLAKLPAKRERSVPVAPPAPKPEPKPEAEAFAAMKQTLKAGGVKVVVAPQLFPTPAAIAAQMIEAAAIEPGMCVLEPSAGTGNLVKAVLDTVDTEVLAYEINQNLCSQLARTFPDYKLQVRCKDFLDVDDFLGCYPRVVMNPPFENGADIRHIKHALRFLAPGGRLVALCADGPRQREQLGELGTYEPLPAGSFAAQGTAVNVAMVTIDV